MANRPSLEETQQQLKKDYNSLYSSHLRNNLSFDKSNQRSRLSRYLLEMGLILKETISCPNKYSIIDRSTFEVSRYKVN